jgi:beta-lactamase family protein
MLTEHIPEQVRAPGEAVSYSNYASALAGRIVENLSGLSFDQYIEKNILTPLEMNHTSFREPADMSSNSQANVAAMPTSLSRNLSTGFMYYAGRHRDHGFEYIHHFGPAGSASSTSVDMARYMIAHLNKGVLDGKRILLESTVDEMRQRNFSDRNEMIDFSHGFFNGSIQGHRYFGHGGATSSFKTMMMIFPELQFGVFVAINQGTGTGPTYNIPSLLVKTLFAPKKTIVQLTPSQDFKLHGQKYTGQYMNNRHNYSRLEKIFSLVGNSAEISLDPQGYLLRTQGGITTAWVEVSKGVFRNAESESVIKFDFAPSGNVIRYSVEAGHGSYDKISFIESPKYFFISLIVISFFALTTLIGGYARRKHSTNSSLSAIDTVGFIGSILSLGLTFTILVVGSGLGLNDFYFWPSSGVKIVAWLSVISAATFVLMLLNLSSVWRYSWPRLRKINRLLFSLSTIAALYALWQWNLLGLYY